MTKLGRGSGHSQDPDACMRSTLVDLLSSLFHKGQTQMERTASKNTQVRWERRHPDEAAQASAEVATAAPEAGDEAADERGDEGEEVAREVFGAPLLEDIEAAERAQAIGVNAREGLAGKYFLMEKIDIKGYWTESAKELKQAAAAAEAAAVPRASRSATAAAAAAATAAATTPFSPPVAEAHMLDLSGTRKAVLKLSYDKDWVGVQYVISKAKRFQWSWPLGHVLGMHLGHTDGDTGMAELRMDVAQAPTVARWRPKELGDKKKAGAWVKCENPLAGEAERLRVVMQVVSAWHAMLCECGAGQSQCVSRLFLTALPCLDRCRRTP